jgi:hypothetical protein
MGYDPEVVEEFAQRLYARAHRLAVISTVLGLVSGAVLLGAMARGVGTGELLIGGAIGAILGHAIGRERGFSLRLQAQTALCQLQIERNTRGLLTADLQSGRRTS